MKFDLGDHVVVTRGLFLWKQGIIKDYTNGQYLVTFFDARSGSCWYLAKDLASIDDIVNLPKENTMKFKVGDWVTAKRLWDPKVISVSGQISNVTVALGVTQYLVVGEWYTENELEQFTGFNFLPFTQEYTENPYRKYCPYEYIDIYRVLELYDVTDPCLQHLVKKALCTGKRGHKDYKQDLEDILATTKRALEMLKEEEYE